MCAGRLEWMGFRENGAGGREDCVTRGGCGQSDCAEPWGPQEGCCFLV